MADQLAALMALLRGGGGGLGVDAMYNTANIQRGRFGMPQMAQREYTPGPRGEFANTLSPNRLPSQITPSEQMGRYGRGAEPPPESVTPSAGETGGVADTADEDMLEQVQRGMGAGSPPPGSGMKWENLEEDQAALEDAPTDQNISAFVEYWGRENLPQNMQGGEGPDYATGQE
jgi:hypothetical protein